MEAVLAYIEGEDADLFNLLDKSAKQDAPATAYRLTYLAAGAVEELARLTGDEPTAVLQRVVDSKTLCVPRAAMDGNVRRRRINGSPVARHVPGAH